jgi:hypothetical protein
MVAGQNRGRGFDGARQANFLQCAIQTQIQSRLIELNELIEVGELKFLPALS